MDTEKTAETTEVTTTTPGAVATLGGRLGKHMAAKVADERPLPVMEMVDAVFSESDAGFESDDFLGVAQALFEKTGLYGKYCEAKGIEHEGNISEWRPTLVGINNGKGKSATELRHMELNAAYNYNTKAEMDLTQKFFPIFIHAEEILKDDSGMVVEDRITTVYNSEQKAFTPGYEYQNIVYLLNSSCTDVFKITVKSSGHKFVTNLLRNYMFSNYKKGMVFNPATLTNWMTLSVTEHTSKSGFTNPYMKLLADGEAVTSDEVKLINVVQREQFENFRAVMAELKKTRDEDAETQNLVDDNTTTDAAGDDFTQL